MGFYDFDAARAERKAKAAPTMLVFGETVDLPRSIPAAIHLAAAQRANQMITLAFLAEMLGLLVGDARVERWIAEHQLEEDDVRDLYFGALKAINERDSDPEADPPETGGSDGQTSPSTGQP